MATPWRSEEEREEYFKKQKKSGEWIDVNENLPKVNERVLVVCVNPQNHMQEHVSICTFFGAGHFARKPLWSDHKRVTHWMPLPELPDTPKERN